MREKHIEFSVGLLVVLSFFAIIFLCMKVAGDKYHFVSDEGSYQVFSYFNNIGNLKIGAPVRASGVLVGRVNNITLDVKSYQAKVELSINKQYSFSQDTSASILTMGILGEQYIGLQQGGDTDNLQPGDTISVTNSAVVIEELLNKIVVNFLGQIRK
ncbi:MAG: outer membrane lipid asymmetry maintenance protein MlaD [Neisseriaceae bacterium]|nr:MAG: outer membrane lipid asymmetry maintenance protein MlaD [Neisseriaceae bacterium]